MSCSPLIVFVFTFAYCRDNKRPDIAKVTPADLLDTIRNESRGARLLFFRDFATSKESLLIKEAKDQRSIDTLLSFIAIKKRDTTCYLFAGQNPVGEIDFYKDTAMTEVISDMYFALDGRCEGWYAGIEKNSPRFDLTTAGKVYLSEAKNRIEK